MVAVTRILALRSFGSSVADFDWYGSRNAFASCSRTSASVADFDCMVAVTRIASVNLLAVNYSYKNTFNRTVYYKLSLPSYARGRALTEQAIKLSKPDVGSQVTLVSSWMG